MWKSAEKSVTSSAYFKIQTAQLFRIWYSKSVWFSFTESETSRLSIIDAWRRNTAELETIFCISICMSGGRFRLSNTNKCLDRRRIYNKLGPNHWCLVQEKKDTKNTWKAFFDDTQTPSKEIYSQKKKKTFSFRHCQNLPLLNCLLWSELWGGWGIHLFWKHKRFVPIFDDLSASKVFIFDALRMISPSHIWRIKSLDKGVLIQTFTNVNISGMWVFAQKGSYHIYTGWVFFTGPA